MIRIRSKNGKQSAPLSTATVSMVHSVPELKVSSEVGTIMLSLFIPFAVAPQLRNLITGGMYLIQGVWCPFEEEFEVEH